MERGIADLGALEGDVLAFGGVVSNTHALASLARRAAALSQGYDRALLDGRWPSEETLPSELRRAA